MESRGQALRAFNTLAVDATAQRLETIEHPDQLLRTEFDPSRDLVLGGGSNVLLAGDVPGTVWLNRLRGRRVAGQDAHTMQVEAAAGENWHELVCWTLQQGLSGLENLSLIPGSVGAAPLQNIGAYGVELAQHLDRVEAWDWQARRMRKLSASDCRFSYRDSRFKSGEPNRFLITAVRLNLNRAFKPRLEYPGLRDALAGHTGTDLTAQQVSDAVIAIRRSKLPDPTVTANAGSFFKNPVVTEGKARALQKEFSGLPGYPASSGMCKLSAAWMIEDCGWKGYREGDAGISERHALVLVNHGHASGAQLLDLARRVATAVEDRFGLALEPEPRIVPADIASRFETD